MDLTRIGVASLGLILLVHGLSQYSSKEYSTSTGRGCLIAVSPYVGLWLLAIGGAPLLVQSGVVSWDLASAVTWTALGVGIGIFTGLYWMWGARHVAVGAEEVIGAIIGAGLSIMLNSLIGSVIGLVMAKLGR